MIQLRALGAVDLRDAHGGELRPILAQPKRFALLAYLAVNANRGFARRDQVLALFWPELDNERARAALNRALYYVRRALGEGVLLSRGDDEIGLCAEHLWSDVAAFEAAAARAKHGEALELYRGDLLEGFFISDAPGFEQWLESERERLKNTASAVAWKLAEAELAAGKRGTAARWARWATERSPYDEAGMQRLVSFLDSAGDRAGAVHAYARFARRLVDELELSPSPETRALVEAIRMREEPATANRSSVVGGEDADTRVEGVKPPLGNSVRASVRVLMWPRAKIKIAATLAVAALAMAITVITTRRPPSFDPRRVVVAPIRNRTGDPSLDRISRITADWITQSLTETGLVETIPAGASSGRPGVDQGCDGASDLWQIAKETRAATIVCGAIYREGGVLRLHAGVIDASRDNGLWAIPPSSAPVDSPEQAIHEVRQRASGAVAALRDTAVGSWFHLATAPPTIEAFTEFVRARASEPMEKARHYQNAEAVDTTFTWAALEAASVLLTWDHLKADSILRLMVRKRDRLNALQQYWLDALLALGASNRLAAHDAMERAFHLAPVRFRHDYALTVWLLNRPRETLRLLDGSSSWLIPEALHQLREHRKELDVVLRARSRDGQDRMGILVSEVRARAALGQIRKVSALIDSARSLPGEAFYSPGWMMLVAAEEFRAHGEPDAATEILKRAIAWMRVRPAAEADSWMHVYNLAHSLYRAERWDEAEPMFRKLAEKRHYYGAYALGYLGAIAARRGDRVLAEQILAALEGLTFADEWLAYEAKFARAKIKALLGDAEGALRLLREAKGDQGGDLHTEFDFESLANDPDFRAFTKPKG
jgi:DNA-binding SARP family transcriptional activator/TolB-like protein